ncbi:Hpr(Ser) kinase/phosphatase [Nitrosomonas nitrosa]|jgi:HPr kinase/phosphorylase|uniref:HPr kinase/phosphorylase n=1 Tax=Nitrosomonas nitrosa TaxID=52442 RepID=A0A1I4MYX1_9PROT|nr:HPr(Ser) kinase/phosphatase [Nitrosomonas nitrosa]MCO6434170.1 HPr kinase/phosphorylase [Nitrosomonas nitrosa]PTQ90592.1 Hpr(Ser) kinase/phosphatase [Nitrosomonas nitrosa]CAE6490161.1 HPr kinase/phosphorylase [Nitrosomonas nitrosa]SFM08160.1 Hpr(Ser) kinase/phosphatase [Nitrosomonas nitrosa]HNP51859.1 HPr(Ser) kinase/phosphatase [Nitrosomonas nitrosa]
MSQISVTQLFEGNQEKLSLSWGYGQDYGNKQLDNDAIALSAQGLIGHLNFIHPNWIQVLSDMAVDYLAHLEPDALQKKFQLLAQSNLTCIIAADSVALTDELRSFATRTQTPILCSTSSSLEVIWVLRSYLAKVLAPSISKHGVLLDVLGMGVMITGESGVGKSELALELISRGHGLVADDVVELRRIGPETLEGSCPPILRDYIEVRGLGMLNIRTIFGETAVRRRKNMKLIVHLEKTSGTDISAFERLPLSNLNESILSVTIRKVIIPVAAGRNLAVLVEAAVRNYILQLRGIDSTQEFIRRHEREMNGDDADSD